MPIETDIIPTLVQFSAMVFGQADPEQSLQALADSIGVPSVAIYREDLGAGTVTLLARNKTGALTHDTAMGFQTTSKIHWLLLDAREDARDRLVVCSRIARLLPNQIDVLTHANAYLSKAWQARSASFEQSLTRSEDTVPNFHILHPTNPYRLTRTELRVCDLIAQGQRPKAIAQTLEASMPTVRTHLRHIYAKTGLDGMLGVMHNLQATSTSQDDAA